MWVPGENWDNFLTDIIELAVCVFREFSNSQKDKHECTGCILIEIITASSMKYPNSHLSKGPLPLHPHQTSLVAFTYPTSSDVYLSHSIFNMKHFPNFLSKIFYFASNACFHHPPISGLCLRLLKLRD